MKSVIVSAALAAAFAASAHAQPPSATAEGDVIVQGVAPEKVLGAIDTEKLVADTTAQPVVTTQGKTQVTVDTTVQDTATARVETTTEVITPVSGRPALDPENPIAPEVQAVVAAKPNYTTADISLASRAAVLATPPAQPTTIITTTRTTPKEGG